jgi:hypothetical protein
MADEARPKKNRKQQRKTASGDREAGLSAAQLAVNEQMRRALEEDQYSANGSIVDTDTDDEDHNYVYKGQSIRLDRNYLVQAARKHLWLERVNAGTATGAPPGPEMDENDKGKVGRKKKKKGRRGRDEERTSSKHSSENDVSGGTGPGAGGNEDYERDEGSIFGQTTGASNSTWVECDKCKKVRFYANRYCTFPVLKTDADSRVLSFSVEAPQGSRRRKKASTQVVLFDEQERPRTCQMLCSGRGI